MAVPKRTRYEVLRRDGFACRYCGATAPDVKLHVDHVMPTALGGSDDPSNLVAACANCNSGKASTSPTAEVVADVADSAVQWASAMRLAAERMAETTEIERAALEGFEIMWSHFTLYGKPVWRPANWEQITINHLRSGLDVEVMVDSIAIAMQRRGVAAGDRFAYYCGIIRNVLSEQANIARKLIESGEV